MGEPRECLAARELLEVIPLVMRTVAAELRRSGRPVVPAHFGLLAMLAHHSFSLSELAEKQEVSLPTMSSSASTLVERGWVRRVGASHDRRVILLDLTPAGQRVLAEIRGQAEAAIAELLAPLSQDERKTLLEGLKMLRNAFSRVGPGKEAFREDRLQGEATNEHDSS